MLLGTSIPPKIFSGCLNEEVEEFASQKTLDDNEVNEKFDITLSNGYFSFRFCIKEFFDYF